MTTDLETTDITDEPSLGELARVFLRLSLLGFGGPNAHIALMLDEVVDRRRWLTREHFLELVAITNLLPGPNSSEVAIHIGHVKRGVPGAIVTGGIFLLPAFLIVTALSALYFGPLGDLPALDPVFALVKPVVLALIVRAAWKLGRTGVTDALTVLLAGAGVAIGALAGGWAVPAMLAGGALTWMRWRVRSEGGSGGSSGSGGSGESRGPGGAGGSDRSGSSGASARNAFAPIGTMLASTTMSAWRGVEGSAGAPTDAPFRRVGSEGMTVAQQVGERVGEQAGAGLGVLAAMLASGSALSVFLLHLGIGAVLFGGGYTLVALLQPLAVDQFGWLTTAAFLDGVALTQAVPGPISTLAAFVGYSVAGVPGAVAGTLGVYLPAFAAVLLAAPLLERLRKQAAVKAALVGIGAVVAGTIVGVAATLVPAAVTGWFTGVVAVAAFTVLVRGWAGPGLLIGLALVAGVGAAVIG